MTAAVETQQTKGLPWWLILLNGIALLIIGALLLTSPAATMIVIVQLLAIYWIISGIFQIVAIFIDSTAWGWNLFAGLLGIIAGVIILREGAIMGTLAVTSIFVLILGIQGIIYGAIGVYQGFKGHTSWGQIILGALSIIFGVYILSNIWLGVIALPWVFGIFAIIGGILAIVTAFKVK